VVGKKNYCYSRRRRDALLEARLQTPFMNAAARNATIEAATTTGDFDRGRTAFVGGSTSPAVTHAACDRVPAGALRQPPPGKAWKAATREWYQRRW